MILDSSAVVAILQNEPETAEFAALIEQAPRKLISAVSVLEASMVVEARRGTDAGFDLDHLLRRTGTEIVPFDQEQLRLARGAGFAATDVPSARLL